MSILRVGMYASQFIDKNFLTFSSDNPFSISFAAKHWNGALEYSTDKRNWLEWDASEIYSVGNVLYLRGLGNTIITGSIVAGRAMTMTSPTNSGISCTGNIMTLLDHVSPETAVVGTRCFTYMFYNCINLTVAPELPATTLATYCYYAMFQGCTNLTVAPELPATTLATYCYHSMLRGCINLTVAPELPATTLADSCYYSMLRDCTSIKISSAQAGIYQTPWRIPTTGTIGSTTTNWNTSMLSGTGGTFTSNPPINTTYYQSN